MNMGKLFGTLLIIGAVNCANADIQNVKNFYIENLGLKMEWANDCPSDTLELAEWEYNLLVSFADIFYETRTYYTNKDEVTDLDRAAVKTPAILWYVCTDVVYSQPELYNIAAMNKVADVSLTLAQKIIHSR